MLAPRPPIEQLCWRAGAGGDWTRLLLPHLSARAGVEVRPEDIVRDPLGKPRLRDGLLAPDAAVEFSVTHSGEWTLAALGALPLGIDVEQRRPIDDWQAVAADCFSAAERAALGASGDPLRAFYATWTRKEALLKALGIGLRADLHAWCTLAPPAGCVVFDCPAPPGYAGAIAQAPQRCTPYFQ